MGLEKVTTSLQGPWGGRERLGRCIRPVLPKPSRPRSVQHRWALRQATQRPPPWYLQWAPIQLTCSYTRVGTRRRGERCFPTERLSSAASIGCQPAASEICCAARPFASRRTCVRCAAAVRTRLGGQEGTVRLSPSAVRRRVPAAASASGLARHRLMNPALAEQSASVTWPKPPSCRPPWSFVTIHQQLTDQAERSAVSDGGEDQGAEEACIGQQRIGFRPFWKPSPV